MAAGGLHMGGRFRSLGRIRFRFHDFGSEGTGATINVGHGFVIGINYEGMPRD
jgi:hypothetical protein